MKVLNCSLLVLVFLFLVGCYSSYQCKVNYEICNEKFICNEFEFTYQIETPCEIKFDFAEDKSIKTVFLGENEISGCAGSPCKHSIKIIDLEQTKVN